MTRYECTLLPRPPWLMQKSQIIIRARQQHLLEEFNDPARRRGTASVEDTCLAALKAYLSKNLRLLPSNIAPEEVFQQVNKHYGLVLEGHSVDGGLSGDEEAKLKMHIRTSLAAAEAMAALKTNSISSEQFSHQVQDILLPYLDSLYGSTINAEDHSIFTKLARKFEDRFMEDVRALNCEDPDVVTRVTEYGRQIVDFVREVEQKGFAYQTSDGSVYFDIAAFEKADHNYARLEPWNRNDKDLQSDAEGALTAKSSEKRSDADFALWKSSKPGEPSWPSPWAGGRPGWHIECSAMASDQLGSQIDIHSGGIDLAFPHHDNELAQSEAYWCNRSHHSQHQWVNYFIHMGHLSIQGSKMSKSLKNFTTIREALSSGDWTPRGLRIVFLLGGWRDGIEITQSLVKEGSSWEEKVNVGLLVEFEVIYSSLRSDEAQNFFFRLNDVHDKQCTSHQMSTEHSPWQQLQKAKDRVYDALCDSFNTPLAMRAVSELITEFNSLDMAGLTTEQQLLDTARWLTSIVNTLGLNGAARPDEESIGWSGIGIPEYAKPYLTSISRMRDTLRQQARVASELTSQKLKDVVDQGQDGPSSGNAEAAPYQAVLSKFQTEVSSLEDSDRLSKDILQLCDRIRDVELWNLGIYLEDRASDEPALIRPVTKELRATKAEQEASKELKKKAKEAREKEAAARADKGKLSHLAMFRTTEYSAWDDQGLPIKDAAGEEITKSKTKKLKKDWERQKKLHEEWLQSSN